VNLPFTQSQFLDLFGQYNARFWPVVVLLWLLTLGAVIQLIFGRPRATLLAWLAAAHWAWSGVVYHALFFTRINPAAWMFAGLFVAQAAIFVWYATAASGRLTFAWGYTPRHVVAGVLLAYSLLYPVLVAASGHAFPRAPAFAVPCPTTIFTAGLLLAAVPPVPRLLFVVPVVWSLIAGSAALLLGITPDFLLFAAAAALVVFGAFRRARPLAAIVVLLTLAPGAGSAQQIGSLPKWLRDFVAARERQPVSEPAIVVRYEYKGEVVYFYPSRCCDVASTLFRADGRVICAPDGGFTGRGDGRCPDFVQERRKEAVVWRDRRGAPPRQPPAALLQRWVRSTEDERAGDDVQAFRPSIARTFPPSRFRMIYEFQPNGECAWLALAPDDAHQMRRGSWSFDPVDPSVLRIVQGDTTNRFLIVELTKQVLKLKPSRAR
jgi:hypothetical protein